MTIQKTKWKPDTCGCEIVYEWDDTVPQEERTHTLFSVSKCPHHQGDINATAYQKVLDENQSKNQAVGLIINNIEKIKGKEDEITWRFDDDRNLILSHPDLDMDDKELINNIDKSEIVKNVSIE